MNTVSSVMHKNKPTVVAVGLYVSGTGFTRVFETLFAHLSTHFDIHWLGIGYKGASIACNHYNLYPVNTNGGDIYGAYGAAALATALNTKNILLLTDFYLLKNYSRPLQPLKANGVKLTAYVPVDGYFTNDAFTGQCLFLDEMVLYNRWAMQEVNSALEKYKAANVTATADQPLLSYIYHGTDTMAFSPAASSKIKQEIKQQLFPFADAANSIFILNANRYNERKDIASTIAAFAKALPLFNKTAYLCLHTPNLQPEIKAQLLEVIAASGCQKNILLNPLGDSYCSNEQLAALYTACDIGINTSYGEGWGMISFEHAACGAAQLVPNHTAPGDVWKEAAVLIPVKQAIQLNTNPFLMYAVDKVSLAKALVNLVNDQHYLDATAKACRLHVNKEMFSWEKIAQQWIGKLQTA